VGQKCARNSLTGPKYFLLLHRGANAESFLNRYGK
jgi:hypothetical protein